MKLELGASCIEEMIYKGLIASENLFCPTQCSINPPKNRTWWPFSTPYLNFKSFLVQRSWGSYSLVDTKDAMLIIGFGLWRRPLLIVKTITSCFWKEVLSEITNLLLTKYSCFPSYRVNLSNNNCSVQFEQQ